MGGDNLQMQNLMAQLAHMQLRADAQGIDTMQMDTMGGDQAMQGRLQGMSQKGPTPGRQDVMQPGPARDFQKSALTKVETQPAEKPTPKTQQRGQSQSNTSPMGRPEAELLSFLEEKLSGVEQEAPMINPLAVKRALGSKVMNSEGGSGGSGGQPSSEDSAQLQAQKSKEENAAKAAVNAAVDKAATAPGEQAPADTRAPDEFNEADASDVVESSIKMLGLDS